MVQFRTRPLVFTRDRSPVYTSLCLKQQYTDIYAVLKSTEYQSPEYQSPVVHDSLLCCKPFFFFTTAHTIIIRPRNRDKQRDGRDKPGDGRDKAVRIGTVTPNSGQLRPM